MSKTLLELLMDDTPPSEGVIQETITVSGLIPVGYQTRIFLERGAAIGEQRTEAVHAARNLLGAGHSIEETASLIGQALEKSPQDPAHPWTYAHVDALVMDLASKPAPPPKPFIRGEVIVDTGKPPPAVEVEEDAVGTFTFTFPELDVVVEISRVVATAKATIAWVKVIEHGVELGGAECELRTTNGMLSIWRFFETLGGDRRFVHVLESARRQVLASRQTGGVTVQMKDAPRPPRTPLRINPHIYSGHLNVVFAAGGSGKSLLMNLWAMMVQGGIAHAGMTVTPGRALYVSWEDPIDDAVLTMDALAKGLGVDGANFDYRYETVPLVEVADDIGRQIVRDGISTVFIDSLLYAFGGDKNDMQTALGGLASMKRWQAGTTTIALDHVPKAETLKMGARGPIGSVVVENSARNVIRVLGWMDKDAGVLHQLLRQTKTNKGVIGDFGLSYTFAPDTQYPDAIYVEREEPPFDVEGKIKEELAKDKKKGGASGKVFEYLRGRDSKYSIVELSQALNLPGSTVKSALETLEQSGDVDRDTSKQRHTFSAVKQLDFT